MRHCEVETAVWLQVALQVREGRGLPWDSGTVIKGGQEAHVGRQTPCGLTQQAP